MLRLFCLLALLVGAAHGSEEEPGTYAGSEELAAFVVEMADKHGFDAELLAAELGLAVYRQSIIDAISRPAEKRLKWDEYQDIFLNQRRIREGREFLRANAGLLKEVENGYGVPPEIIAAVLGVETYYGRIMGAYRVMDALATLAFNYPPRSGFFRAELEQFLLLAREERRPLAEFSGSYAGAMGYGQFIPSSYRAYAIDQDGDGRRDIWRNKEDATGSVANYLAKHGWQSGEAIVGRARVPPPLVGEFGSQLKPHRLLGELLAEGVVSEDGFSPEARVAPLLYHGKGGAEYWLARHNFYVITRYNRSKLYAMAVYQLSRKLVEG